MYTDRRGAGTTASLLLRSRVDRLVRIDTDLPNGMMSVMCVYCRFRDPRRRRNIRKNRCAPALQKCTRSITKGSKWPLSVYDTKVGKRWMESKNERQRTAVYEKAEMWRERFWEGSDLTRTSAPPVHISREWLPESYTKVWVYGKGTPALAIQQDEKAI